MGLLDLFVCCSLVPVLKVLLLTAVGSLLAIDRIGILGEDARKHLNSVSLFCNLNYFFQSYMYCFRIIIALGWMLRKTIEPLKSCEASYWAAVLQELLKKGKAELDQSSKLYYLGLILTGNLGNLLLIIIPAVCREKGSPFGAVVSILDKIKQCLKMNGLKIDMRMLFAPSTAGARCNTPICPLFGSCLED
ncbi:hypothetical protein CK203_043162 [Vitis vinifera]|uniref:Uncharacterized protein n=1 Tax=Vitis vinifera TaxID=29760 RepID=A0A438H2K4_VITVI|nr:hypothetical protein CK203_043162 [Vitis vinifera]